MRAREARSIVKELEAEEAEAAAHLEQLRATLVFMQKKAASLELAETAASARAASVATQMALVPVSDPSAREERATVAHPGYRARLSNALSAADLIDKVLSETPVSAEDVFDRVLAAFPGTDIKMQTVRWNLNHFRDIRGWIRGGTRTRAVWSRQSSTGTKEAANGT